MPAQIAILIFIIFLLWLYARESALRPMTSWSLWVPLVWVVIVGTRSVSFWFGEGITIEKPEDYINGSPLDRAVYFALIAVGVLILLRRRLSWSQLISLNRWFIVFLFYLGISIIWSDYPFTSFKRWTKELGNVIMVLIILTEQDPSYAIKAVFVRYAYIAIPLSVIFIKYYPDIGRYYNPWTYALGYSGVATNKNELGIDLFICGLFLMWDLIDHCASGTKRGKADFVGRIALLLMLSWLVVISDSTTSLWTLFLSVGILFLMCRPLGKRVVGNLGAFSIILVILIALLSFVPSIPEAFVGMTDRDMTFTGRTDIWADLLRQPLNPILGAGYSSFWMGSGGEFMWAKYYFHPTQAHNGYLETYLNGGLIGVGLLAAVIVATGRTLQKEIMMGSDLGVFRFAVFIPVLLYNWTEAMFTGLSLIWIVMLIAILNSHHLKNSGAIKE
jgi:exopolysaccharide production protein ExoQ